MSKRKKRPSRGPQTPRFGILNWVLLGAAVILIAAGFFSLSRGSVTLAPILLVAGYCVVVPLALLLRPTRRKNHV